MLLYSPMGVQHHDATSGCVVAPIQNASQYLRVFGGRAASDTALKFFGWQQFCGMECAECDFTVVEEGVVGVCDGGDFVQAVLAMDDQTS